MPSPSRPRIQFDLSDDELEEEESDDAEEEGDNDNDDHDARKDKSDHDDQDEDGDDDDDDDDHEEEQEDDGGEHVADPAEDGDDGTAASSPRSRRAGTPQLEEMGDENMDVSNLSPAHSSRVRHVCTLSRHLHCP